MTLKEDVQMLREFLTPPARWTKEYMARDNHNNYNLWNDKTAVKWHIIGAIRLLDIYSVELSLLLTDCIPDEQPDNRSSFVAYNDAPNVTHADILALLDRAIEKADYVEPYEGPTR